MHLFIYTEYSLVKQVRNIFFFGSAVLLGINLGGCSNSKKDDSITQGYIEGRYIYIASNASGELIKRPISRGSQVTQHQLLFKLDPHPQVDQLEQAQAQLMSAEQKLQDLQKAQRSTVQEQILGELGQAQADLALQAKKLPRYKELYRTYAIDKQTLDDVTAQYDAAVEKVSQLKAKLADAKLGSREHQILAQEAEVKAAAANVKNLTWQLAQKTQYSPAAGEIFDTFYRVGEFVPAGQAVMALLTPQNLKVIFFVPEAQVATLKPGQTIYFNCDSCKEKQSAKIVFISPNAEYTPPVIYSRSARAKLVYRIEALPPIQEAAKYHPGQPIDVTFK